MSALLSLMKPVTMADAILTSSTAAETDYTAYSAGTTYAVGNRCISTTTHRVYESLIAGNVGNDPTLIDNRIGTTPKWSDVSATNKWKMFDDQVASQTSVASPLTAVLHPGFVNAIGLLGLDAETITVTVKDAPAGNTIYSYTGSLEGSTPFDYYEYFFSPFQPLTDFIVSGIDPYADMQVTVTLTKASGNVMCGMLQVGDLVPLGTTQYGAKAKPKTYSYIKINDYGENEIIKRKKAKDLTATAWLKLEDANNVLDTIGSMLDVPCIVICSDRADYSGLRSFGLVSGEISYDHPQDCLLSVSVNGLI